LTFYGIALVFWMVIQLQKEVQDLDNGPGTFDLKPRSISYYQVKR